MGKQKKLKVMLSMLMAISLIGTQVSRAAANTVETENDLIKLNRGSNSHADFIVDGDFEAGGSAWSQKNQGIVADGVSYGDGVKSGCVPKGAMSGKNVSGYIGQIVSVKKNTDYEIKGYVKSDVEGAKANIGVRANNDMGAMLKETTVTSTEWKEFTLEVNSGDNSALLIQLVKWAEPGEEGYDALKEANIYIDNVTVVEMGENLIVNGDFETAHESNPSLRQGWNVTGQGSFSNYDGANVAASGEWYGLLPRDTNNACVYQNLTLKSHTNYVATAKVLVGQVGASAFFNVKTNNVSTLVNGAEVTVDCQEGQAWQWQDVELRFNTGNNTNVQLCVMKWCEASDTQNPIYSSQFYVDDVTLREVPTNVEEEVDENYDIIWADDFNGTSLDTSKWEYELGCVRGVEQQHYVKDSDNVYLEDGKLVLEVTDRDQKDQYQNPRGTRQVIYNSGSVRTHGHQEFLYGRIEMKAKLPKGQGIFPAFWTLGADFTLDGLIDAKQGYAWARCGEIDIMELIGGSEGSIGNREVYHTIHTDNNNATEVKLVGLSTVIDEDFYDNYHVFGIDWSPNKISFYVDDQIVYTADYTNAKTIQGSSRTDPLTSGISYDQQVQVAQNALNRPQYIQLNLACGGNWPGDAGLDLAGSQFIIDYVYYAQNAQQKAAAQAYYADAAKLSGVKDIVMTEGDQVDLLENVTVNDGYFVDYSIENSPMFTSTVPEGGQTFVKLLGTKQDTQLVSQLKAGTYSLHYSGIPNDIQFEKDQWGGGVDIPYGKGDTVYKFARQSVTLTVLERTFPADFELNITKGGKLSDIALPERWTWDEPDTVITTSGEYAVTFTQGDYHKTVKVNVTVSEVNVTSLQAAIIEAKTALKDADQYTDESIKALEIQFNKAKALLSTDSYTQEEVDSMTQDLQAALDALTIKEITPVDSSALEQLIQDVKAQLADEDQYTEESLKALKEQLELAENLLNQNPTQDEIDAMKEALNTAFKGLTEKENPVQDPDKKPTDDSTINVKPATPADNKDNEKPNETNQVETADHTLLAFYTGTLLFSAITLIIVKRRKEKE